MPPKKFKLPKLQRLWHNPLRVSHGASRRQNHVAGKPRRWRPSRQQLWTWSWRVGLAGLGAVIFLFAWYAKDLPTPQGIRRDLNNEETTKIFDRTGEHLLYAISGQQRRISIPFEEMPENIKKAVISIEDKNFYRHSGFDLRGYVRAIYYDIVLRRPAQGGSTITQQLVKNAVLRDGQKRLDRKIRELIISIELETMFDKDKILQLYLNEIPFGGNTYGVEAASQTFFGKKAKDLDLAEAATLAALPKAPNYFSPYGSHVDDLIARRNLVLKRMAELDYITEAEAETASQVALKTVPRKDTILAPHFVMYVRDLVAEKYGETVFDKGLSIITTLDIDQQKAAETAVASGAATNRSKYGIQNAALVALNPKNGEVLAMVGSADYFDSEIGGQFNVITAKRQPGSAFKPLVYAALLKDKYSPASIFWDVPTDFGDYQPNNFDGKFRGPITMRNALAQSLNIPAVKALALAGIKSALGTAEDLGIKTLDRPDQYGLSLVLGSAEVKPLELATAYGTLANAGVRHDPLPILKITEKNGKILEENQPKENLKPVIDPAIAWQISDILADQGAKAPVFGNLLSFGGRQVASKTGTTNGFNNGQADVRDAWTVGYTPSLVVAIWTGNNDHSPLGKGVLAANAAVPIFRGYMSAVLPSLANETFSRPSQLAQITVAKLSGKLPTEATPPDDGRLTDWFAPWQVPTKEDDVYLKVRLCKGTNLVADAEAPASEVEEKFFVSVHSEKPADSRWENPVREYAKANGLDNQPPTEKCTAFTAENRPQIFISKPNGTNVTGTFEIEAGAGGQYGVASVDFYIDDSLIGSTVAAPYRYSYEAANLSAGTHKVAAVAKDPFGREGRAEATFTVGKESTPPGLISGLNLTPISGGVSISWTNPTDLDLDRIRIYVAEQSGNLGLRYSQEPKVTPGSNSNFTLSGLSSGKTYFITLRAIDSSNNENQNSNQQAVTPQ